MSNRATEAPTPAPASGPPPSKDLLVARSVSKVFGGLVAVSDVDFSIPRLSIVSIIGPNGAGKTTFFNMLTGLYKPTTGAIAFDGKSIADEFRQILGSGRIERAEFLVEFFCQLSHAAILSSLSTISSVTQRPLT